LRPACGAIHTLNDTFCGVRILFFCSRDVDLGHVLTRIALLAVIEGYRTHDERGPTRGAKYTYIKMVASGGILKTACWALFAAEHTRLARSGVRVQSQIAGQTRVHGISAKLIAVATAHASFTRGDVVLSNTV
jgi:hypothetical protein